MLIKSKFLFFIMFFLLSPNIKSQECDFTMEALVFITGFPQGGLGYTYDYNDPYLIKWNDNKISGDYIYLDNLSSSNFPYELSNDYQNSLNLQSHSITEWNSNYGLKMKIETSEDNVKIRFSTNAALFETGDTNNPAIGRTFLPVEDDIFAGYRIYEYTSSSVTGDGNGFPVTNALVYFNNIENRNFSWTTSVDGSSGSYMLGTVLLHELGHVLSMGHSYRTFDSDGNLSAPNIMDKSYDPSVLTPYLTSCDKYNAEQHSLKLYNITVGIGGSSIVINSFPSLLDINKQYYLNANFSKGNEYSTDHVLSWNWKIKLYHANGIYEYVNRDFSGTQYWLNCAWTLNTTSLPNYTWTLNQDGHIAGVLEVTAQSTTGTELDKKIISFNTNPTKPQSLKVEASSTYHPLLSWNSNLESDVKVGGKYKIYHALSNNDPLYPYSVIATINHNPNTTIQQYHDLTVNLPKPGEQAAHTSHYYKVVAVDNTLKESIPSDAVHIMGKGAVLYKNYSGANSVNISEYKLFDNYPNPFNPNTKISFNLKEDGLVRLRVYNSLGEMEGELLNDNLSKGSYTYDFNAQNLASGIYFYIIEVNDFKAVKKMLLVK